MKFVDRLPEGAANDWRYPVLSPQGGLSNLIDDFLLGEVCFLDLTVYRDFTELLVRIVLPPDELIRDSSTVFRVDGAPAILLNEDGQPTDEVVTVTGSLNKEVVSEGMPAGMLTIWSGQFGADSLAS